MANTKARVEEVHAFAFDGEDGLEIGKVFVWTENGKLIADF